MALRPPRLLVLVTGGTFDKEYDEFDGSLSFRRTHVPEMLRLWRCGLDVSVRTIMMVDKPADDACRASLHP